MAVNVTAMPTLKHWKHVAIIVAIFDREGTSRDMAQTMGQHTRNAEFALRLEQAEIKKATAPDSPGGEHVVESELISIMEHRIHRQNLEMAAASSAFAKSLDKNGFNSPHVQRMARQYFMPDYDDAA